MGGTLAMLLIGVPPTPDEFPEAGTVAAAVEVGTRLLADP